MISDRYDSSNDMNPTISPFNHPEVPYIYEWNFSKFEESLINLIRSNLQFGKLLCRLDINGTGDWKDIDFAYEKCAFQKKDNGEDGDGIKVRYILHFHEPNRYVDALKYMDEHWIPDVSRIVIAKMENAVLDTSQMAKCSIKFPISRDLAREFETLHLSSPEDLNKFNDVVIHFISDLVSRMRGTHDPTNDVLVWVKDHFKWRHAEVDAKIWELLDWNGDLINPLENDKFDWSNELTTNFT